MSSLALEQQVNLYQPILGAERRLFSARAIGVALTVLAVCLVALASYGSRRTGRVEHSIDEIEKREAANIAMAARASQAARPAASLADLDAEAKLLGADIDVRQHALEIIHRSRGTPATGFAARLEALARPHLDGIWLSSIVLSSGEGRLAMRGAAIGPEMVPAYLAALAAEPALAGAHFDKLAMRRASPEESPAQLVFELDGPGLAPADKEHAK